MENKEITKENLILPCKSNFLANLKNMSYVDKTIIEAKDNLKRTTERAKAKMLQEIENAKSQVKMAEDAKVKKQEQLKDIDNAWKNANEKTKEAWGEKFNYIEETEAEYLAYLEEKRQAEINWWTSKGYKVPKFLLKEKTK